MLAERKGKGEGETGKGGSKGKGWSKGESVKFWSNVGQFLAPFQLAP